MILALDIGGTKIFAGVYTMDLELLESQQIPTNADASNEVFVEEVSGLIQQLRKTHSIEGIAIAMAGFIDKEQGVVKHSPNLPNLKDLALKTQLEHLTKLPIIIENDARMMALAEASVGTGKGVNTVLGLIVGTGIGAGLIVDGTPFEGAHGFATEVGQTEMLLGNGPVEDSLAGQGLVEFVNKHGGGTYTSPKEVEVAFYKGIETATKGVHAALGEYSLLLYNLILLYNPDMIVLGGGIGSNLLGNTKDILQKEVEKHLEHHGIPSTFRLEKSELKNAGSLGAAIQWKQRHSN